MKIYITLLIGLLLISLNAPLSSAQSTALANIELVYDTEILTSEFNVDRWVKKGITVTNNRSTSVTLGFKISSSYDDTTIPEISPFPQPNSLYLSPGENQTIWYFLDKSYRSGLTGDLTRTEKDQQVTITLEIWDADYTTDKKEVSIEHLLKVRPDDYYKPNTTIEGQIYDELGKPIQRSVEITFTHTHGTSSSTNYRIFSNNDGSYKIDFYAHQYADTGDYLGYNLKVDLLGYKLFNKVFFPKSGEKILHDINLVKQDVNIAGKYTLVSEYETGYPIWLADIDDAEKYIALSHGHHNYNADEVDVTKHGIYFFDTNGNLLWRYLTKYQVWGIDLSDDGNYVAASIMTDENSILFNKNGEILWDTTSLGMPKNHASREIRISHNSKYVAIGGDDYLKLLDLATGTQLWKISLNGQIRGIIFDATDSILYIGSGDGYAYKLSIDGEILGKAYVEAWPYRYSFVLSHDSQYIVSSSKIGKSCLVRTSNMKTLWCFDVRGGGHWAAITSDNTYVFIGSGGSYPAMAFDLDGNMLWFHTKVSKSRLISEDGKYIMMDGDLYNLNGKLLWDNDLPGEPDFSYIFKDNSKIITFFKDDGILRIWTGYLEELPVPEPEVNNEPPKESEERREPPKEPEESREPPKESEERREPPKEPEESKPVKEPEQVEMTSKTTKSTSQVIMKTETTTLMTSASETMSTDKTINNDSEGGGCLIATAAFGSELSPQIQFLRGFRDQKIMSTEAGANFMKVFNQFYYSFSPQIAEYERSNPIFKNIVKYTIYPLIGILQISETGYNIAGNSELGAIFSGFIAAMLIGVIYLSPFILIIKPIRQGKTLFKKMTLLLLVSLSTLIIGIINSDPTILMITTSFFILTTIIGFSVLTPKILVSVYKKYLIY